MRPFKRFFRPPTEAEFARQVVKTLARVGDKRQATFDQDEFRLVFMEDGKHAGTMNLRNLYGEYCNSPRKSRSLLLRRTCAALASQFELPDEFEDVKPDLLPTIRPKSMLEIMRLDVEIQGGTWNEMPSLPLSDHLEVCLVYDLPTRMQFVMQPMLETWGVTLYEASEVARQNLEQREFAVGALGEKFYVFVTGDAYDATRMLLVDRIRALPVNGQPVALAINRDSLLVAGSDDEEALGWMADLAEKKRGEPRPLCAIPHLLVGDDWQTWRPPLEHPHYQKFRTLELRYLYGEYGEQKSLLEKLHQTTGEDIFVASFGVIERDGKTLSWSLWSKGITSWLPETDYVGLGDAEREWTGFVPWDVLRAEVGHLMQPMDRYPPRWLVAEFPSPEQIARMQPENWVKHGAG